MPAGQPASELAEAILQDCRGAVGEVRFGFGSKRQVWAFEDRHQLDVTRLVEELAAEDGAAFLELALAFHDEFAEINNPWPVRDRIQALVADLCLTGNLKLLASAAQGLVDDKLAVRHWLVAAFVCGPAGPVFEGLEAALTRAYQPADQWALLGRLRTIAQDNGWTFGADTARQLASLAQLSPRPQERIDALELLARFGGPASSMVLARAAR